MVMVQDILISDEVLQEAFVCNLEACKGACCWEGDYGAPLEPAELSTLAQIFEDIRPFLLPEAVERLQEEGLYAMYDGDMPGTTLMPHGACAYMTYDESGIAQCGIERAFRAGATDFQKPISCHLYPIRVKKVEHVRFEALNYDRWDICKAACQLGKKLKVPVYQFLREPLIRKYGAGFYEELDAAARHLFP
ncbi:MAG: DUF3109 family protein [Lewinellaceae bacterium]|nr:DUF3109 family protein [Lewinellaceae bacterium]